MRYALRNIEAEVDQGDGIKINTQIAVAGQPIPAAYDDLVADEDATTEPPTNAPAGAIRQRQRVELGGTDTDPAKGYGPTHDANEAARETARESGGGKRTKGGKD